MRKRIGIVLSAGIDGKLLDNIRNGIATGRMQRVSINNRNRAGKVTGLTWDISTSDDDLFFYDLTVAIRTIILGK